MTFAWFFSKAFSFVFNYLRNVLKLYNETHADQRWGRKEGTDNQSLSHSGRWAWMEAVRRESAGRPHPCIVWGLPRTRGRAAVCSSVPGSMSDRLPVWGGECVSGSGLTRCEEPGTMGPRSSVTTTGAIHYYFDIIHVLGHSKQLSPHGKCFKFGRLQKNHKTTLN